MVTVVVFEFSGLRCQPLRRALGISSFVTKELIQCWFGFLLV